MVEIKVSICVPIYGVEKYIERCVVSLFEQTYSNLEYIFVNDCSLDNSIQILNSVLDRYPQRRANAKVVNHSVNKGLAAARNTALLYCTGDFVLHVDSDDYIIKNCIELLVKEQLKGNFDIVSSPYLVKYSSNQGTVDQIKYSSKRKYLIELVNRSTPYHIWGRLIRRDLYLDNDIRAIEGCDMAEDYQVIPKLLYYAKTFSSIDIPVYEYNCVNENSYSNNFSERKIYQTLFSIKSIILFFENKDVDLYEIAQKAYIVELAKSIIMASVKSSNSSFYVNLISESRKYTMYYKNVPLAYRIPLYISKRNFVKIYSVLGFALKNFLKEK